MPAEPVLDRWTPVLDRALSPSPERAAVAGFLVEGAHEEVLRALEPCLPPSGTEPVLRLVRAKLKPGRKLTAEYDVVLPEGLRRRIFVSWVTAGAGAPGPAPDLEAEARRLGVLSPFLRSWVGDGRMSVSVAPVDPAFPSLVRLHDRTYVRELLRTAVPRLGGVGGGPAEVQTVRYRPGQRHVLRLPAGDGCTVFAKVYRDDTGRHALEAAARVRARCAAAGVADVTAGAGAYGAPDRVALWPEVTGRSLTDVVASCDGAAEEPVRSAGAALRLVHGASPAGLADRADARAQAMETLRTAELVSALMPGVGARLHAAVGGALELLEDAPVDALVLAHGDFKCDNVLVGGSGVHLLDFDRSGAGDPAADIGKFLADLRWWTDGARSAERLREAFLSGYGAADAGCLRRARAYETLLLLRMAARRVPIQDRDWEHRVSRAVDLATAPRPWEA